MLRGVAIGGFMGVGKSAVGAQVAKRLGLPFVDTDQVLAQEFGPIEQQFAEDGESVFRARERQLVAALCGSSEAMVVATGGGMWADAEIRASLKRRFRTVVLDAPLEVCLDRLADSHKRPLQREASALWEARRPHYQDAEHVVDAAAALPQVVEAVMRCVDPRWSTRVALIDGGYEVCVADGWGGLGATLRARFPEMGRVIVVSEPRVFALWGAQLEACLVSSGWQCETVVCPLDESSKTLETWSRMLDAVLRHEPDRQTVVVALGGGVLGDIAGFVASTALRGLPWVQVPTTLLAMADSGVGGKTGVNHGGVKNRVGAFHQPSLVYVALCTLSTLPAAEWTNGMAEVVKTAVIGDAALFEHLEETPCATNIGLGAREMVCACLRFKAAVVSADPTELGRRALLNAGHTVGHALERALPSGSMRHGEAVAIGLVVEARWAEAKGVCREQAISRRLERLLTAIGLPTRVPQGHAEALAEAIRLDKKVRGDRLKLPVPRATGHYEILDLALADVHDLVNS